jgi:hypothetical protein
VSEGKSVRLGLLRVRDDGFAVPKDPPVLGKVSDSSHKRSVMQLLVQQKLSLVISLAAAHIAKEVARPPIWKVRKLAPIGIRAIKAAPPLSGGTFQ